MGIRRYLQHWFTGRGPYLQPSEFVPESHPMRLWADTFPWEAMVQAVEHSFAQRFPPQRPIGGRPPVSPRVLLALELLKHEVGESDEDVCHRLRTDVAIQAAAALEEGLVSPAHLLVDTFPSEQGSQRVTDATTLYKAPKKAYNSSSGSRGSLLSP